MSAVEQLTIVQIISAVMAEVQAVGKGDRNNEQGYNFRGIDAVVNAVGPVFRRHGVVPVPMLEKASYRDVQTSRGKPSRECTVQVRYRFYGPAGDYVDAIVPGESMDFGDKGTPKAMSVAYRIVLLQLLTIPTHEPEPDAQSYERDNTPQGPTPEQVAAFDQLAKRVAGGESEAQLLAVWEDTKQSVAAGQITGDHGNQLKDELANRRTELATAAPVETVEEGT